MSTVISYYTNDELIDKLDNFIVDDYISSDEVEILEASAKRIKQQMDTLSFLRKRLHHCEHIIGELYVSQRELEEELYG
mgnify:CR=1 FL=1